MTQAKENTPNLLPVPDNLNQINDARKSNKGIAYDGAS